MDIISKTALSNLPRLRENRLFSVQREEGSMVIGITDDAEQIPRIIQDELCADGVVIKGYKFNKQNFEHTLYVDAFEDADKTEHEFTVNEVTYYSRP